MKTLMPSLHMLGVFESVGMEWDPRICISNKTSGNAAPAVQGPNLRTTNLDQPLGNSHMPLHSLIYVYVLSLQLELLEGKYTSVLLFCPSGTYHSRNHQ